MKSGDALYSDLLKISLKALSLRDKFDNFWAYDISLRPKAHHAYFIRHISLLNAFDDLLFLFCSRQLWSAGGIGYWAAQGDVGGPLQALSNGDQIDKVLILLQEQKQSIIAIFNIYQQTIEREHMEYELEHIQRTIKFLNDTLDEIQI